MPLIRVAVESSQFGQQFVTVLYYDGTDPTASVADAASGFVGSITDGLRATLHTSGHLDQAIFTEVLDPGDTSIPDTAVLALGITGQYGASGGDNVPTELCGLCKKVTGVPLRGAHGWVYGFPLLQSGELNGENLDTTGNYWPKLVILAAALDNVIVGALTSYEPVVYSRTRHRRGDANYFFTIASGLATPRARFLRKRPA